MSSICKFAFSVHCFRIRRFIRPALYNFVLQVVEKSDHPLSDTIGEEGGEK